MSSFDARDRCGPAGRRKTRAHAIGLAVGLALTLVLVDAARSQPPPGLTEQGRLQYELEALLHDRFGDRPLWLTYSGNFTPRPRAWQVRWRYYPLFTGARGSSFTRVRRRTPPITSPFVQNVRVGRRYVVCEPGRWLVLAHGTANLALDCISADETN